MYYVKTETENYDIITSYATLKQATRYGATEVKADELHLFATDGDLTDNIYADKGSEFGSIGDLELEYFGDLGRVRTVYSPNISKNPGRYLIYIPTGENPEWFYSGISFNDYGDANKFLKSDSITVAGEILVVENPNAPHIMDSRGAASSTDIIHPDISIKPVYNVSQIMSGVYDE